MKSLKEYTREEILDFVLSDIVNSKPSDKVAFINTSTDEEAQEMLAKFIVENYPPVKNKMEPMK